jgi:nucleoside-triphosphatase
VIRTVAARMHGWRLGGFFTEEIRTGRQRQGFALATFDGRRATMAHVDHASGPRVSKYVVDVVTIEEMARSTLALSEAIDLYLVDEIGKMECLSPAFVAGMRALLDAGLPVVATIGLRGGGFIDEVKRRPDVMLWEITRANRDTMPAQLEAWITDRPRPRARGRERT